MKSQYFEFGLTCLCDLLTPRRIGTGSDFDLMFLSLNCICPLSVLTPGNSMNFGCGAVGKAASDCVVRPTGESKEGYVTTTLGVVISLVFLM